MRSILRASISVRLPLLDQRIFAEGKLPSALESEIAAALRQSELVLEPVVTVTVTEIAFTVTIMEVCAA